MKVTDAVLIRSCQGWFSPQLNKKVSGKEFNNLLNILLKKCDIYTTDFFLLKSVYNFPATYITGNLLLSGE